MPKATPLQPSFNAGELSPLVYGRVDAERYKAGLGTCLNYIPTLQGPLIRRPGTKYVTNVKDSSKPPVLIPFKFSQNQNYVLEFGENYIRFYSDRGQIISPAGFQVAGTSARYPTASVYSEVRPTAAVADQNYMPNLSTAFAAGLPLELTTPYSAADVAQIKFAQNADTLFLVHPNYPVFKLQRLGTYNWRLQQVLFRDGPYLAFNSYQKYGDNTTVKLLYKSGSSTYNFTTGPTFTISSCVNNGSGLVRVVTSTPHLYLTGQKVVIDGVVGTTEANNPGSTSAWTITVIDFQTFDLQGSAFSHAYTSGGTVYPALFVYGTNGRWNDIGRNIRIVTGAGDAIWGYIANVVDPAHVQMVVTNQQYILSTITTTTAWQLGVWRYRETGAANFPSAVSFHQNRLFFAGTLNEPQEVDGSQSGDYENFAANKPETLQVVDTCALQFTLASNDLNKVQWLSSEAQGLLAGTESSEWLMQASATNQAMTPTNFNASQTSFFGAANIACTQAGNATLYVQRSMKKLREMNYFFQVATFRSTDLTELSEHLPLPGITAIAVQKEVQPLIWTVLNDGTLLSMTYNRDDMTLKAGWARHRLGGRSDAGGTNPIVTAVAVVPALLPTYGQFDQMWMVVTRFLNGVQVRTIETLTKPFDDSFTPADSYHFDCGATLDNSVPAPFSMTAITLGATTTITSFGAHGLSAGQLLRFDAFTGLNVLTTDINGQVQTANMVNGKQFLVANPTTYAFEITDLQGNAVNSSTWSPWVFPTGEVRKMVSTVSGLTWLANETVSVLVDGGVHPNVTVSNTGTIALQTPGAKIQIGFDYNSDGQNLRLDAGSADGTSIGKTRRISKVAFMLRKVGVFYFGPNFNDLLAANFMAADSQQADSAVPLYTGIYRDLLGGDYDFEAQVCWRQNSGLPGTIQALTCFLEEMDV